MKTTLNRVILVEGLRKLGNVMESKQAPIFTGVKIETTSDNQVSLTVGNKEVMTVIEIGSLENTLQGGIIVPYKLLNNFLKKSKADNVTIEQLNDNKVSITASNIDYKLQGINVEEFPSLPHFNKFDTPEYIELSNIDYTKAINNTAYCVSKSDSRPILKGVQLHTENNTIRFIGTDSHRLGRYITNIDSSNQFEVVLDGKMLTKSLKMMDKKNESVLIGASERYTIIKFDNVTMYFNNLEGNYPETSRLIPESFNAEIEINTKETIESVEMLSTIAKEDRNNVIRLNINNTTNTTELSSNSPEIGDMTAKLNAKKLHGDDLKISFSALYFAESLKALNESNVKVSFTGAMRPFLLNSSDNKALQLILPVRTY